jgi:hypothetical protein
MEKMGLKGFFKILIEFLFDWKDLISKFFVWSQKNLVVKLFFCSRASKACGL